MANIKNLDKALINKVMDSAPNIVRQPKKEDAKVKQTLIFPKAWIDLFNDEIRDVKHFGSFQSYVRQAIAEKMEKDGADMKGLRDK